MTKRINVRLIWLTLILCVWMEGARAGNSKSFVTAGLTLRLQTKSDCKGVVVDRTSLGRNLAQYDASSDPRADIRDETPRTKKEVEEIRSQLVEDGFVLPNGNNSVITWMDYDNDGICDFTATVGIGGARSTERMMLFRGLGNREFRLADSHLSFMDTEVTLIPYIPVFVSGESVPIILVPRDGRMLRWRKDLATFEVCNADFPRSDPMRLERVVSPNFRKLCDSFWDIVDRVERKLPDNNRVPSWR